MKTVNEFNPNNRAQETKVREDQALEFPNVQTCLAVVGKKGDTLVGVHLTIATKNHPTELAPYLEKFSGCPAIFVLGGFKVGAGPTVPSRRCSPLTAFRFICATHPKN